ncbi:aminotransferase class I/II-fold pyridoxal phosphate-dependent enzyme [Rummeliibacillus sp. NPDC094406]|uniref:aminotransferase class I/II-fold pyridoxal phosphate-dependent enzyme n=1 Tax=Rummeliibacillus sp. NPDC094406 TaxID=3364511 RepID=UPI0037F88FA2
MNQLHTPLFDVLENFYIQNKVSYHVPGHKNGQIFLEKAKSLYEPLLSVDATELTGLDDLHAPEGPIRDAESLLAELYGVMNSYFLVNGSTVGNLAMILATCGEGDTVLVQRNCHKSVLHGLMLANVKPVFLAPGFHKEWGVAGGVDSKIVLEALELYPDSKAIILTYPNYYGLAHDLTDIITFAHKKNIPVLVDEAHGAHFKLSSPFPKSSLDMGADVVIHSAHKTLPAMTMGSYLHINSLLVDVNRVEFYLQMLQSSSPSYPIMGSLDLARAYLSSYSQADQDSLIKEISQFKVGLSSISEIEVLEHSEDVWIDPLKISIRSKCGLSGYELQALLEEKGIYSELADPQNVLFVLPLLKKGEFYPFDKTTTLIKSAVKDQKGKQNNESNYYWLETDKITTLSLSYSKMKQTKIMQVTFNEAIGKISGEMVIPYPPGIPLIMSGEKITSEKISILENLLSLHSRFHGGTALANRKLVVYEED